jgi:hypothetical protein
MRDHPRPAFVWLVALLSGVYVAFLAFAIYAIASHYGVIKDPGWTLRPTSGGWFVSEVAGSGPAAGRVEIGDRLLALNGDERAAVLGTFQFRNVAGEDTYRVDFERRGQRVSLELPLRLVSGRYLDPLMALTGLAFFVCGAGLALLRPRDPQVRLVGVLMISVAFAALNASMSPPRHFLSGWERQAYFLMVATGLWMWTFPMTYHVFNRFPDWRPPNLPSRTIQWLLYGIGTTIIWPTATIADLGLDVFNASTGFLVEHPRLYLVSAQISGSNGRGLFLFMVVCLALALVASARNYRRLEGEDSRRRIRWVLAGLTVALIPFIVLTFASRVAGWISYASYRFYIPISFLALLCIPASIIMAVWKQQLFDIRVLVRRGLQYLFARAALRTLLVLPVALLVFSIVRNPNRTIVQILTEKYRPSDSDAGRCDNVCPHGPWLCHSCLARGSFVIPT